MKPPADGVLTRYKSRVQLKNSPPEERLFEASSIAEAWTEAFKDWKQGAPVQLFYETEPGTGKFQFLSKKSVPAKAKPSPENKTGAESEPLEKDKQTRR